MSEIPPLSIEQLHPGDVIEFADLTELVAFEDLIAPVVEPKLDQALWAARPHIRDFLRPPKFNGTIADIALTVMAEPYERLLDARERGWKIAKGGSYFRRTGALAQDMIARYRGFTFTAQARSSRPENGGPIEAELWYYPGPHGTIKAGTVGSNVLKSGERSEYVYKQDYTYAHNTYGEAIRRAITVPRINREPFIAQHAAARKVGFEVLQQAMMHPVKQQFRN